MINPINGWKWNVEELQKQLQGIDTSNVTASYEGSTELIQDVLESLENRINNLSPTTSVGWVSLTANGSSGEETTTVLTATFDADPTTLGLSNYSLSGASLVSVAGTGLTRTIEITNITVANGESITLTLTNPSGYNIVPLQRSVPVVVVDLYEPEWIELFNLPEQDENGDTIISSILSPTARIMYVSENGDDDEAALEGAGIYSSESFPDILNPEAPIAFRTLAAAYANVRNQSADVVLLERGGYYEISEGITVRGGIGVNERAIIAAYGVGDLPILNRIGAGGAFSVGQSAIADFLVIKDINFKFTSRDPNHPDFVGWENMNYGASAVTISKTFRNVSSVLIEGCIIQYASTAISTGGVSIPYDITDLVIRRNLIRNSYKGAGGGHPQGIGLSGNGVSVLVEENVLDSNGYYPAIGSTSPAVPYSHSIYAISVKNSIFRNNISYNPSSIHFKFTADIERDLITNLTGVVSEIQVNSILQGTPQSGWLAVRPDDAEPATDIINLQYVSHAGNIVQLAEPYDFTERPVTAGTSKISLIFTKSKDVSIYGNVFVDGEIGLSFGGNENTVNSDIAARFANFRVQNNVLARIGHSQVSGRTVGWGINPVDNEFTTIEENIILGPDNTATTNVYAINAEGFSNNNIIRNNHSYDAAGSVENTPIGENDLIYSNAENLPSVNYVDPTVSIEKYAQQNGYSESVQGFIEGAISRDVTTVPFSTKDIINYIRSGFTLNSPVIIQQPSNGVVSEGSSYNTTFNVIGNRPFNFQWYDANTNLPISGLTSNMLKIDDVADVGDYYCRAFNVEESVQSDTISISEIAIRNYLSLSGVPVVSEGKYIQITPITIQPGYTIKLKAKCNVYNSNNVAIRAVTSALSGANRNGVNITRYASSIMRLGAVVQDITWPRNAITETIFNGEAHSIDIVVGNTDEHCFLILDNGEPMPSIETRTSNNTFSLEYSANTTTNSDNEIWDIEVLDQENNTLVKYDIDSGVFGGATESASIGTGTASMFVAESDWIAR